MSTTDRSEGTTKSPTEKSIARAASSIARDAARPSGVIDQRTLDREIADRFAEIGGCRVEVARTKQVKPPEIVADRLLCAGRSCPTARPVRPTSSRSPRWT
jgi:hypothetical protein